LPIESCWVNVKLEDQASKCSSRTHSDPDLKCEGEL
jgi:hypothetical protein